MMKKSALASSALMAICTAASLLPTLAHADDGISYNVGAVSDYRYRGVSQTDKKPALQGGVDYAKGPFYVGTWLSTISWIKDAGGGNAPAEWDIYAGYKGEITKDLTYDVGTLAYVYLGQKAHEIGAPNPDTGEIYGALSYGIFTAKYSHSLTNLFGFAESKNSGYLDLSATYDLGNGFSIVPHVGYQSIPKKAAPSGMDLSYTDYALTVNKDFGKGLSGSVAVLGTDADKSLYYSPKDNKETAKTTLVVGVKYSF